MSMRVNVYGSKINHRNTHIFSITILMGTKKKIFQNSMNKKMTNALIFKHFMYSAIS